LAVTWGVSVFAATRRDTWSAGADQRTRRAPRFCGRIQVQSFRELKGILQIVDRSPTPSLMPILRSPQQGEILALARHTRRFTARPSGARARGSSHGGNWGIHALSARTPLARTTKGYRTC